MAEAPSSAAAASTPSGMATTAPAVPLVGGKRAEIYTYDANWPVYAMNWSVRRDKRFRLAIGSFIVDDYSAAAAAAAAGGGGNAVSSGGRNGGGNGGSANPAANATPTGAAAAVPGASGSVGGGAAVSNRIEVVHLDDEAGVFRTSPNMSVAHQYPATKVMWIPDRDGQHPDLFASTGDYLRIWEIEEDGVKIKSLLNNNKNSEFCAPLTSFDWNEAEPKRIGTSSIDTTCTIWDIEKGVVDTQLIAHDKEVYDIAWGGVGVFASVSADGSVRVFDLRDKEHSTIIYESPHPETPLLRLGWNKQDPRYMATILQDSPKVVVLDIRFPTLPVAELQRHQMCVNALAWAPHSSCHICTAGDDSQALIWDLSSMQQPNNATSNSTGSTDQGLDPILAYTAGAEITQLQWSSTQPDWVAIAFANKLQILRV
eukprot:jgi/Chlat1/6783/Chrsp50S06455